MRSSLCAEHFNFHKPTDIKGGADDQPRDICLPYRKRFQRDVYHTEDDAQPDKFPNIPEAMWWAVGTLTTVGYGDMEAVTPVGKTLTSIIAILGIGIFALPAGILASGFSDELNKPSSKRRCPHCGGALDSSPEQSTS